MDDKKFSIGLTLFLIAFSVFDILLRKNILSPLYFVTFIILLPFIIIFLCLLGIKKN